MNNYKFHYEKKGYVVIENVLNNSEIQNLRKLVKNYFIKRKDENLINVSACYSNPEITKLVMNKKLLTACRQIIGKQVFINELEVQFNSFPNNSKVPPHYDGQSQKNDNFFKSSSYKAFKLGIYLQDTCDIYGGGINIVPNTHKYLPFKSKLQRFENLFKKLASLFAKKVNIKAGDAVLFNHKLLHRGIWPLTFKSFNQKPSQKIINKLMFNNEKIVVYWNVLNKKSSDKFLENSFRRSVQQEVLSRHRLNNYFTDYLSLSFPKDYNKKLVKNFNKEKISVSTLDDRKLKLIKYINNNILN